MTPKELIEKYSDTLLTFLRYYKYSFTFEGFADDGTHILMTVGGSSDGIYRYEVTDGLKTLGELEPDTVEQCEGYLQFGCQF